MKSIPTAATLAAFLLLSSSALAGDLETYRRDLIQGDVRAALQELATIPAAALPAIDATATACVRARFGAPPAQPEGPGAPIVAAYRTYWHALMLRERSPEQAQAQLLASLNALLPGSGWDRSALAATSDAAVRYLEQQGLHALGGVTSPYYELMVWRSAVTRDYPVRLPEQDVTVRVVLMDDFLSRGWLDYASCGRMGTGGWTAHGTLYALAERYDTQSEQFRVSYLGHEGQHFADNQNFPQLEQAELEYRAKLTEIILASDPRERLAAFARGARHGRAVPHPHAEWWLTQHMQARLAGERTHEYEREHVRAAARALLSESSAAARAAGAATVQRLLPD